jgi:cell wall-associated NlpC family hydrolase
MGEIQDVLQTLHDRWTARHGIAISDLKVGDDNAPMGSVLTYQQRADMASVMPEVSLMNVVVLEDRDAGTPEWRRVEGQSPVALYRSPDLQKLTTEVAATDGSLRWLGNWGADLVQADDGAIAWGKTGQLKFSEIPPEWPSLPRLGAEETCTTNDETLEQLQAIGSSYLDVPYVLGGRSQTRIDCSGLMSRIFRAVCQVILPRHSMDQRRCGTRVGRDQMSPGDLIFARLNNTRTAHVGLLLPGESGALHVLHASQRAGKVVSESLADFETGYRFMGARRILEGRSS